MSLTSVDLPDPLTPVTAVRTPSGILTSMFLRLFSRAPRILRSPFIDGRRAFGVVRGFTVARTAPAQQFLRRALEDHMAAEVAGARTEIDHVVGDADRLLVVFDDDHGVPEIAKARERR